MGTGQQCHHLHLPIAIWDSYSRPNHPSTSFADRYLTQKNTHVDNRLPALDKDLSSSHFTPSRACLPTSGQNTNTPSGSS